MNIPTIWPGTYRHYKGNTYEVLGVALHTETNEYVVIYRPLYKTEYELFARPYHMFLDMVTVEGKQLARFKKIS